VALPFGEQQGRDEEAREHEERVDAQVAAGEPTDAGVVQQDRDDRDRAKAVERGQVREAGLMVGPHGWNSTVPGRFPGQPAAAGPTGAPDRRAQSTRIRLGVDPTQIASFGEETAGEPHVLSQDRGVFRIAAR
jgi:hypothetical protein